MVNARHGSRGVQFEVVFDERKSVGDGDDIGRAPNRSVIEALKVAERSGEIRLVSAKLKQVRADSEIRVIESRCQRNVFFS